MRLPLPGRGGREEGSGWGRRGDPTGRGHSTGGRAAGAGGCFPTSKASSRVNTHTPPLPESASPKGKEKGEEGSPGVPPPARRRRKVSQAVERGAVPARTCRQPPGWARLLSASRTAPVLGASLKLPLGKRTRKVRRSPGS